MLRKFFGLLALLLVINFSAAEARLEPVTDKANLLSAQEVDTLNKRIRDIEQVHKVKIGVIFVKTLNGRNRVTVSNDLLDQHFNNGANGSILLLVDMNERKYEIATSSRMSMQITDTDGIPFLKDKFKGALSSGDYYGAVNGFVNGVDELMTFYTTNGAAYGTTAPQGFDPAAAVGAVIVSLFCGVTIRSWLIGSMSNVRHAMEATDYLKRDTVKFTEKRDMFLFKNVKRRPRSGGGRSGGGGSHGSGHGGGGGSF